MTQYNLLITDTATKDLLDIVSYRKNELSFPGSAELLIKKVRLETSRLKEFPFLFPLVEDEILAGRGIRKLSIDRIIIFHIVSEVERNVTILRILHAKRDWVHVL